MNKEKVTVQDCVEMQEMKNQSVILNDGKVVRFEENPKPKKVLWFSRHKMTEATVSRTGER